MLNAPNKAYRKITGTLQRTVGILRARLSSSFLTSSFFCSRIEFTPAPLLTLQELFRVVKQGGTLVVEEPDISTFAVKLIALVEKIFGMRSHIISGEQIAGMFAACCKEARVHRKENTVWVVVKK